MNIHQKIIILAAPSGAGKTTIKSRLMQAHPDKFSFSVSATTRQMRDGEKDGIDYHFIDVESFQEKIEKNEFVEWEMVYPGKYYGTTIDEMKRIWKEGKTPILDIDVKGALNVKRLFRDQVLSIFIAPPSLDVLESRLKSRGTDSDDNIQTRLDKAEEEMSYREHFDLQILNDNLDRATAETTEAVLHFIS